MRLRLANRSDWKRLSDYVGTLPWVRDGKAVMYRVTVEELVEGGSDEQKAVQHVWFTLAAQQLKDDTAEGYRGYCKLHFGVPILRRDSEEYREAYDRIIRPMPYEHKLLMMQTPIDYPVTRGMNKKQRAEYLDKTCQHLIWLGVDLEREAA